MMRKDTTEKEQAFINRQLKIPSEFYRQADDLLADENKLRTTSYASKKKSLKDILPELIGDGVKFRKGDIYTPAHRLGTLSRDDKWIKLKAKAIQAIQDMREYEEKNS